MTTNPPSHRIISTIMADSSRWTQNDWHAGFPVTVDIDEEEDDWLELVEEMIEFCTAQCVARWRAERPKRSQATTFRFELDRDAVAFALRFR